MKEQCEFLVHGATLSAGMFSMPSLSQLRSSVEKKLRTMKDGGSSISIETNTPLQNMVGDARSLHTKFKEGTVIQGASQFNFWSFRRPMVYLRRAFLNMLMIEPKDQHVL